MYRYGNTLINCCCCCCYICFVSVHSGHGTSGQPTVINFSLLSKTCEEKGNTNINLNMYIFLRKIKCFMRGNTENVLDL